MTALPDFAVPAYGADAVQRGQSWSASMMATVPPERRVTVITRDEYAQLLALAYAKGYSDAASDLTAKGTMQ